MDIRLIVLLLILIPIVVGGAVAASTMPMNTWLVVVLGGVMIYLAYTLYARRIDKQVIQTDPKKATPAKMYMDGVDFMPTSRNVLYGYHFKSIAAAGPITGPIVAAGLWGWFPSILWLILGVTFIGWAADYSAIMLSVRNDGNSLSAIAYRLIAPRTRTILFVFIFFYLLLVAGAFMGVMTALMSARPDVPLGLFMLAVMGLLAGQMLYRWKMDLILVTAITVIVTLAAMLLGPVGSGTDAQGKAVDGPIVAAVKGLNGAIDSITGGNEIMRVVDPTKADPRLATPAFDAATNTIKTLPNYIFWALFLLVFSYLGANLPIWRFAQPVNYIGFWISILAIGLSAVGAILAPFIAPKVATFAVAAVKPNVNLPNVYDLGFTFVPGKQYQPLWPMLFITIACGAISGWHSLIGSVNTSRQIEFETDALPVGGGGMLTENALGLLSLTAVSITGLSGVGAFATGIGKLLDVIFGGGGGGFVPYGTALGYGVFMVIVITVTQLLFRVMRVTLTEWLGEAIPVLHNMHVASIISMLCALFLLLTGTWVYLWQLFGSANQLMAALGLLIVSVWLKSTGRNPLYALVPMLFMYITDMAAIIVLGYNQYVNVLSAPAFVGQAIVQIGGWVQVIISVLLFVCALIIAWDAWKAWQKYSQKPQAATAPAK